MVILKIPLGLQLRVGAIPTNALLFVPFNIQVVFSMMPDEGLGNERGDFSVLHDVTVTGNLDEPDYCCSEDSPPTLKGRFQVRGVLV